MRNVFLSISLISVSTFADFAWGHGFEVQANSYSSPTALSVFSQEGYFNNLYSGTSPENGVSPENMFIEEFSATPTYGTMGTYYSVIHGFAATSGPYLPYTATFNVVSPLYYSNGIGSGANQTGPVVAQPASAGTFLDIYDLWVGDPGHPGASSGTVSVNGTTSFASGFGVSLTDPHELAHDLYLSATSTQTYGEYAFAYTVTVHFPSTGATLTTVPLVDVYALSDPNLGDFPDNASYTQQDAASVSIFQAATRVEPPSWSTATSGSWNNLSNWANWPGNGIVNSPPFGAGVQVAINAATGNPLTITLDSPQTIGTLILGNSASNTAGYTISSGSAGTLTLNNLTAGAQIFITGGSNAISANIILADNLWISPSAGTTLLISGNVSESTAGQSLTLSGPGTLVLSGSNSYTGGTTVCAGTLKIESSAAIPSDTSLTVGAGGTLVFDPEASYRSPALLLTDTLSSTVSPVPEPGTLTLLFLGGLFMLLRWNSFRRTVAMIVMAFVAISLCAGPGKLGARLRCRMDALNRVSERILRWRSDGVVSDMMRR
ncbi:MAG: autotransporter-associated beta strand repeat-containing protein, partial [Thermoguttaceae bacterium]